MAEGRETLFDYYEIFVSDEHGAQMVFMVQKINLSPFLLVGFAHQV